jgi:polyphosphate kinase 2 (PPK2 family)
LFESAELDQRVSKQEYAEREPALRAALLAAQARLADSDTSLVIVIAGAEGAGKGETVNTLLEWLDARGIEAHALGEPSSEEAERPRFYRFWRRLPPRGQIGIFFGSWYTAPIVRRSLGDSDSDELDRELDRIADFERMLADEACCWSSSGCTSRRSSSARSSKLASDPIRPGA